MWIEKCEVEVNNNAEKKEKQTKKVFLHHHEFLFPSHLKHKRLMHVASRTNVISRFLQYRVRPRK